MLTSKHAAGLLFLNRKATTCEAFKKCAGARTEAAINGMFDDAVSPPSAQKTI